MSKPKKEAVSSSSSSSDEDDERLQQLKDSVVTFESLKSISTSNNTVIAAGTELKSKRGAPVESECNHNLDEDSDDLNNFKVTPEFQRFVAKKLQKKLDE
jgi:hypothetical protein